MKAIFILSFIILTSCGQHRVTQDPTLVPYTQKFMSEGRERGVRTSISDVSIKYGNLKPGIIGVCTTEYTWDFFKFKKVPFKKTVKVDANWWSTASEESKEQLMSHELGHCSLDQDHRESYFRLSRGSQMIYKSIMNPSHINPTVYSDYQEYYYDELFNPKTNPVQTFAAYYDEELVPFTFSSTYASGLEETLAENHEHEAGSDCHVKIMAGEEDPSERVSEIPEIE